MNKRHLITTTIAAAAAAVALAACGSSGSGGSAALPMGGTTSMTIAGGGSAATGTPAVGAHNSADVAFAAEMIPHHRQAVEMADMALRGATDATVKSLAKAIKNAQDPEIATMSGWLAGWGETVPSGSTGSMGGMSMPGMMSAGDMAALTKATGAAFDRLWTQMMTTHHQGALTMARTELANGRNADAKSLARSIIATQTAQIRQLRSLLASLPTG